MAVEQDGTKSRWMTATEISKELRAGIPSTEPLHVRPFSLQLEEETPVLESLKPDGAGTDYPSSPVRRYEALRAMGYI